MEKTIKELLAKSTKNRILTLRYWDDIIQYLSDEYMLADWYANFPSGEYADVEDFYEVANDDCSFIDCYKSFIRCSCFPEYFEE